MPTRKTVPLPGSERRPVRGARVKGPISGDEPIEVRITLKAPDSLQKRAEQLAGQSLQDRKYVSREEFENTYGAEEADIKQIEQFAREHNLSVSRIERGRQVVYLNGTARDMSLAFQTYLEQYEQPDGSTYRGRRGPIHIPEELAGIVLSVSGLDDRPAARPKLRLRPAAAAGPNLEYKPQDVAKLYSFPTPANTGQGQSIGIIELGGGYRQTDLNTYFAGKEPQVTAVSVDGGHNKPTGNPDGPDGEVVLDIEVAGGVAPQATIAVYFAPNTNKGFLDAISAAVHDSTRKPSVISISWGSAEDGGSYSTSVLNAFDQAFQAAAVMGVTVLVAAGDGGSSDGVQDGANHVDFPASSPHVTACGGTRLVSPDKQTIQSETVWNDGAQGGATGGGISKIFPVPSYQQGLSAARTDGTTVALTGRGVPDIAADADPQTGYDVLVDGQSFPIGGTSAVAPLMAGLVALMNQQIGKPLGFWNPLLYPDIGTPALRDITQGNNGTYEAAPGWDACTGVGAPVGTSLVSALEGQAKKAAGTPSSRKGR
jgi:kumamolisin